MNSIIFVLSMVSVCIAREAPYSGFNIKNSDSLESVNAQVMERLRQEVGSERGVYHVYLPDGRLQRVQYTAAPVRTGQQDQAPPSIFSSARQDVESVRSSPDVYYVQVPSDSFQQLQADQRSYSQQQIQSGVSRYGQQQGVGADTPLGVYYVQTPSDRLQVAPSFSQQQTEQRSYQQQTQVEQRDEYSSPLEVNSQYLPLTVVTPEQLAQLRSQV